MKKKLNMVFFSICFLTALLAEAYCIQVLDGDLFSAIGIGFVVLITGYLLLDTIRSNLEQKTKDMKFYFDRMYREETDKWNIRYNEVVNLQKATYTATKKNTAILSEQFEEAILRLETLESNNSKALQKLTELQIKLMEGQKNALNLEINYNKENTKQLINALHEESNKTEQNELMLKILEAIEKNNVLLQKQMQQIKTMNVVTASGMEPVTKQETIFGPDYFANDEETLTEDFYEELDMTDHITEEEQVEELEENTPETVELLEEEQRPEVVDSYVEPEEEPESTSVYLDQEALSLEMDYVNTESDSLEEDTISTTPTIKPLYDDPNKPLTADEIAALFASFG